MHPTIADMLIKTRVENATRRGRVVREDGPSRRFHLGRQIDTSRR